MIQKYKNLNTLYENNGYVLKSLHSRLAQEMINVFNVDYDKEKDYTVLFEDEYPVMLIISDTEVQTIITDEKHNEIFYTPFIAEGLNALNLKLAKHIELPLYHENGVYHVDYEYFCRNKIYELLSIDSVLISNKKFDNLSWVLNLWPTVDVMKNILLVKTGEFPENALALYESFYTEASFKKKKKKKKIVLGSFSFIKGNWNLEIVSHEIIHSVIFLTNLLVKHQINLEKVLPHLKSNSKYTVLPKELLMNEEKIATIFGILEDSIIDTLIMRDTTVDLSQQVEP